MRTASNPPPVIAIDGPTASGKGTVAMRVADQLSFHYLDSGALYRLVAFASEEAGISVDDESGLGAIASRMQVIFKDNKIFKLCMPYWECNCTAGVAYTTLRA